MGCADALRLRREGAEAAFKSSCSSVQQRRLYDHYGWLCWPRPVRRGGRTGPARRGARPLAHPLGRCRGPAARRALRRSAAEARQSIAFDPNFPRATPPWLGADRTRRARRGIAEMEWAERVSNGDPTFLAQLGEAYATVGRRDEALAILRRLETLATQRVVSPYAFAYVYTGLGEHERALDYLEQAHAGRSGAIFAIKGRSSSCRCAGIRVRVAAGEDASGLRQRRPDPRAPAPDAPSFHSPSRGEPPLRCRTSSTPERRPRGRYRLVRELGRAAWRWSTWPTTCATRASGAQGAARRGRRRAGAERFTREIAIAARLSHPHILPLTTPAAATVLFYVSLGEGRVARRQAPREGSSNG